MGRSGAVSAPFGPERSPAGAERSADAAIGACDGPGQTVARCGFQGIRRPQSAPPRFAFRRFIRQGSGWTNANLDGAFIIGSSRSAWDAAQQRKLETSLEPLLNIERFSALQTRIKQPGNALLPGEAPAATAQAGTDFGRPLSETEMAMFRSAAQALKALNPSLEISETENGLQVSSESEDEALTIDLFGDSTMISIPYWHENADHVLSKVDEYLRVIHRETGLYAFDPQTEQLVDLEAGLIDAEPAYQFGVDAVGRIHNRDIKKKPWWKIW